uniref:Uncharacterized protein n=1 Tax=Nelumbo nucifera TaxID=4432 RepID=A0A822ZMF1_NELNU|nr:TPA_asm: hypothetical protein HUJ06_001178 [Nelumbo nucifera]
MDRISKAAVDWSVFKKARSFISVFPAKVGNVGSNPAPTGDCVFDFCDQGVTSDSLGSFGFTCFSNEGIFIAAAGGPWLICADLR